MRRPRLRGVVSNWIVPGAIGLVGATIVIAGAEIGGTAGWIIIGLAAVALVGVMTWAVRTLYTDDFLDDE